MNSFRRGVSEQRSAYLLRQSSGLGLSTENEDCIFLEEKIIMTEFKLFALYFTLCPHPGVTLSKGVSYIPGLTFVTSKMGTTEAQCQPHDSPAYNNKQMSENPPGPHR